MVPPLTEHSKNKRLPLDKFFHGRSKQLEAIKEAFQVPIMDTKNDVDCTTNTNKSTVAAVKVVLVSGVSGVGKTTLLQKAVADASRSCRENSYNTPLVGTADFERKSSPALDWIETCLGQIVAQIMGSLEDKQLRDNDGIMLDDLDTDHQCLLASTFPSTAPLFRTAAVDNGGTEEKKTNENARANNSSSPLLGGGANKETMVQLQLALKSFLRMLSQLRTVILVLEDLQWCDKDSFELLTSLLTDLEASNLVVCGTFRSNEETDELRAFRDKLSSSLDDNAMHVVQVGCFSLDQVHHMMEELLDSETEEIRNLSRLIHQRTAGNIFFIRQLLDSLQQERLIEYDWMGTKWRFDIQRVRESTAVSENVLQVVVQKIRRLEADAQKLLQLCACLGCRFNIVALEICLPAFPEVDNLGELLALLCNEKFLDDVGTGWFKFSHDKVYESAGLLLPTGMDREELHWRLGKLLWNSLIGKNDGDSRLWFVCTDQINLGAQSCVSGEEERLDVAKLNLSTARRSSALSAFRPACGYCKEGIDVLGKNHQLEAAPNTVALDLYVHYAEMLYCVGKMSEAKEFCSRVFASSSPDHKVRCYITMMQILNAEAKNQEVLDFGFEALKALGENIPKKPNMIDAFLDQKKATKLLKASSDEDVLSLPTMQDPLKAASLQVMQYMLMPMVHLSQTNLHTMVLGRMLSITFKHGLTKWTPETFAVAGVDIIARKDNIADGYRLGKLAIALVDRLQAKSVEAKVCMWTSTFTLWWVQPLPQCLDISLKGYDRGMLFGDSHSAFHNITGYALGYFYSGMSLEPLLSDLEQYCQQMIDYGQHITPLNIIPCWQCALNLCGKQPSGPLDMTKGHALDKQDIVGNEKRIGEQACWSFLLQLCYYLGDFEQAADLSQRLQGLTLGFTRAGVFYPTRVFFFALSAIERWRTTSKRKFKQEAKEHVEQISKWVASSSINLVHKSMLLRAEMESLQAKQDYQETKALYDKAFSTAMRTGFLQDAALASQLAAAFCENHLPELTAGYLVKAWEQWRAWGAVAVAEHLEGKYPDVFGASSGPQRNNLRNNASSSSIRSRRRFTSSAAKLHEDLDYRLPGDEDESAHSSGSGNVLS